PVLRESNQRNRRRKQTRWDGGVGKSQHDKVGLPAGGEARTDLLPSIRNADGHIGGTISIKGQAFAALASVEKTLVGVIRGDGSEEIALGHGDFPGVSQQWCNRRRLCHGPSRKSSIFFVRHVDLLGGLTKRGIRHQGVQEPDRRRLYQVVSERLL